MRWQGRRESDNVEDRRNNGGSGFGGGRIPGRGRGLAVGGGLGAIIIIIITLLLGGNPTQLLQGGGESGLQLPGIEQQSNSQVNPEEEQLASFVRVVLADNEYVWDSLMQSMGQEYRFPKLVLFRDAVSSGCGQASSQTGPFYCPADEKIYIDLSFYDEMRTKFNASGDFAMAYVLAHEVGHHLQHVLGITTKMRQAQKGLSEAQQNKLSVMLELQADCLAGIWAHHGQKNKQFLEAGDIEEALTTASAIGDDKLQMQGQGYVVPESFTHGTSQERMTWFKRGFETGDIRKANTFNGRLSP